MKEEKDNPNKEDPAPSIGGRGKQRERPDEPSKDKEEKK